MGFSCHRVCCTALWVHMPREFIRNYETQNNRRGVPRKHIVNITYHYSFPMMYICKFTVNINTILRLRDTTVPKISPEHRYLRNESHGTDQSYVTHLFSNGVPLGNLKIGEFWHKRTLSTFGGDNFSRPELPKAPQIPGGTIK